MLVVFEPVVIGYKAPVVGEAVGKVDEIVSLVVRHRVHRAAVVVDRLSRKWVPSENHVGRAPRSALWVVLPGNCRQYATALHQSGRPRRP